MYTEKRINVCASIHYSNNLEINKIQQQEQPVFEKRNTKRNLYALLIPNSARNLDFFFFVEEGDRVKATPKYELNVF